MRHDTQRTPSPIEWTEGTRDRRRVGIGRRMMESAERGLRSLGCPKVNLQVRALRRALPEAVRVGTVDRFQGLATDWQLTGFAAFTGHP